jgi:hypothetical protein
MAERSRPLGRRNFVCQCNAIQPKRHSALCLLSQLDICRCCARSYPILLSSRPWDGLVVSRNWLLPQQISRWPRWGIHNDDRWDSGERRSVRTSDMWRLSDHGRRWAALRPHVGRPAARRRRPPCRRKGSPIHDSGALIVTMQIEQG